jgi:alpha-ketoglutarate-dependent 2,4-dichlorophenoxyacetate dioxygenase
MPLSVRELHPGSATEVLGLDLAQPLPEATVAELQDAMDQHGVLVFRGQHLNDDSQIAFARLFGPPERYVLSYRPGIKPRLGLPEMVDVSNLDATTGEPQDRNARHRMANLGNRLWHTDSSFKQIRGALSMLYAHAVPPEGGETEFGDGRAAYDRLPESMKQQIAGLRAQHSLMHSRAMLGFTDFTPEEQAALPPSEHPLVSSRARAGNRSTSRRMHPTCWECP